MTPTFTDGMAALYLGDALETLRQLPSASVHCVVTSPPYYGLRDYGHPDQLGQEPLHDCAGWATGARCGDCYVCHMTAVFDAARRVLRPDGTLWLNIGDCYNGSGGAGGDYAPNGIREKQPRYGGRRLGGLKRKDLVMIPARLGLALQADGWYVRSQIVWAKTAAMPEAVSDRPTAAWETIWLLSQQPMYYYDAAAVRGEAAASSIRRIGQTTFDQQSGGQKSAEYERNNPAKSSRKTLERFAINPGSNQRNVWQVGPEGFSGAHFAVFPTEIPRRCILAGTSEAGCCPACGAPWRRDMACGWAPQCRCAAGEPEPCTVLDPFAGSGTTLVVAKSLGRRSVGIELNPDYLRLASERILAQQPGLTAQVDS